MHANAVLAEYVGELGSGASLTLARSSDAATRRALADALCALAPLAVPLHGFSEHVALLLALVQDGDVGVRLAVARGVALFFDMFEDQRAVMTSGALTLVCVDR